MNKEGKRRILLIRKSLQRRTVKEEKCNHMQCTDFSCWPAVHWLDKKNVYTVLGWIFNLVCQWLPHFNQSTASPQEQTKICYANQTAQNKPKLCFATYKKRCNTTCIHINTWNKSDHKPLKPSAFKVYKRGAIAYFNYKVDLFSVNKGCKPLAGENTVLTSAN